MIRKSHISYFTIVCALLLTVNSWSQQSNEKPVANKVIVDGKTFYLHEVAKGEGFYGIAKKYGVSQKEIHEANPKSIFGLKPGDILYIPVIGGRNSSANEIEDSGAFIYHTIEKGQTLYYLSRKYDVAVDIIKKYNAGSEGDLLIGTIFKIPTAATLDTTTKGQQTEFVLHTVRKKETLYGISRKYKTSVDTLIKYNPALQSGILAVNSQIRIPILEQKESTVFVDDSLQPLKLEDDKYIYHKIKAGETIYAVSKKYRVSEQELELNNPDLNPSELPLGFVVRIPKAKVKKENKSTQNKEADFILHSVRRKETLYSIARKYKVQVVDIEEANPTKMLSNVKKGMKIKVPTLSYLARVKEEARMAKLAELQKEEVVVDTIGIDCDGFNYYASKPTVKVALLLPFDVEATRKINIIKKMEGEEEVEVKREEPIISPRSRTFLEFYEGAIMAVDSFKKQGVNIQLYTYDTAPDSNRVKQILARPELSTVDLIIGPAYASNLSIVSDFSKKNKIKMVYPLSSKNEALDSNPYLFQVNAPDTLLYNRYADYIVNRDLGARIVVLKSSEADAKEDKLSTEIKKKVYLNYLPQGLVPDFVEIAFSEQNVQGVEALLSKDKVNMVVIPSSDEADISKIITTLHGVSESTEVKIKLIGFGDWLRFQTIDAEEIHDLDTEILTPYVLDHSDPSVSHFSKKYRSLYHTEPFAVSPYFIRSGRNVKYSRYGIWGFDVAYYFIGAQVEYGSNFEHCVEHYSTEQVQFNFNFKRFANWGGFYNDGMYVIGFTPSLNIYRKPLQ
ncbi:PBP1 and LysM peptidoglycan-binding domain-containing protein [Labilibacter marinus]|uniref:PBP1 and LysM peptidoglycan-binding domain-containing protein n=1 Tax=Labilibacter marinus TaxID=1477105 RepID=UPI00095025E4|nr:LysM peptidoglycan-binding domain-containing protein [Labilibacter marinus]